MPSKLKSLEEISQISKTLKQKGKTIVTTNGSFDILHPAHINLLEKAKFEGDILIVLLNSDISVKKLKGPSRPIQNENDRSIMLSALESVDYITIFNDDTPLNLLENIQPHIHVKGGSFIPERIKEEQFLLKKWDGKFKNFPFEEGYSTTSIIEKILKSKI
ncbi:MAG: adenylyltransferase/cytidyltransferase family protein [Nanoarchaeota archaeon]|nr:adenylyltransferase/cytidyltransferase family protein [Nanoarchaeota archaeon]